MTTMMVAARMVSALRASHDDASVLTDGTHGDAHDDCQKCMYAESSWSDISPSVGIKIPHAMTMLNQQTMRSPESSATP